MNKKLTGYIPVIMLLCMLNTRVGAQDSISYTRLGLVAGITTTGFVYGHVLQTNMWWKGEKSSFHFEWQSDWTYAMGADKIGHAFFPYMVTRTYGDILHWTGLSEEKSIWYAASLGMTYQTFIEIRDGFSKAWGFSWGDFGADAAGAALPVLQYYYPSARLFHLKISYRPSERFKNNSNAYIMDDYESTYHWLSLHVHELLPATLKSVLPPWIDIAVGHSVDQLDTPAHRSHQLFISIDWNLEGIKTESAFLRSVLKFLNHYHLPAPAIQIYPVFAGYGFRL